MIQHERLTVSLPSGTKRALEDLAEARGISVSAATKHILAKGLMVEAFIDQGGEVTFKDAKGQKYVLASKILPGHSHTSFSAVGDNIESSLVKVSNS